MLAMINAAEAQFRHESEARMRDHALLASIRERRNAQRDRAVTHVATASPRPSVVATRGAWPRPIVISDCETPVCAT